MNAGKKQNGHRIFLGFGGNQGDRLSTMQTALSRLTSGAGLMVQKKSSLYETEPWGVEEPQPWYYNAVAEITTGLSPAELLAAGQKVEDEINCGRKTHNQSRQMDIDILFYGPLVSDNAHVTVPHPRAAQRRFVLAPMAEIAPEFLHPVLKQTMRTLLAQCPDRSTVRRLPELF
jgi:2-amino-4-hydroxy-6-hydroxymethyldihydropteridine diphosphokinase